MTPEQRAAELLPCECIVQSRPQLRHDPSCPAYYRPAVAAALAEAGRCDYQGPEKFCKWRDEVVPQLQAETAALRQRVAELEAHLRRDHAQDCGIFSRTDCSCGWNEGTFNADDERDALRERIENWKQVAFEADQAKGCLEEKVTELEADIETWRKVNREIMGTLQAAKVEGLREAAKLCDKNVWASQAKFDIDAEIAALERGKE